MPSQRSSASSTVGVCTLLFHIWIFRVLRQQQSNVRQDCERQCANWFFFRVFFLSRITFFICSCFAILYFLLSSSSSRTLWGNNVIQNQIQRRFHVLFSYNSDYLLLCFLLFFCCCFFLILLFVFFCFFLQTQVLWCDFLPLHHLSRPFVIWSVMMSQLISMYSNQVAQCEQPL